MIRLNGTAPPKVKALWSSLPSGTYGAGHEVNHLYFGFITKMILGYNSSPKFYLYPKQVAIFVDFTSPVEVKGVPELILNTGCHFDQCTTKEIQRFICTADEGSFALSFNGGVVVNIPASATQDELKNAIESLPGIEEVTVTYGDDDDREYSHGDIACSSRGNNVTVIFNEWTYHGSDGDLPLLRTDSLNAPADPRTFKSTGDGAFLSGRFPDSKVQLTQPVEVIKGWRKDDGRAFYTSGSGTSTLTFTYVIKSGDLTDALDVLSINLTTSAIMSSPTGEAVNPQLPDPGQNASILFSSAKSLSFDRTIIIDTKPAEVVNVTTTNMDGEYTSGDVIEVVVTFNVPVMVTYGSPTQDNAIPYVYLNTGGVGGKAYAAKVDGTRVYFMCVVI